MTKDHAHGMYTQTAAILLRW